jgi:hypothetical protein
MNFAAVFFDLRNEWFSGKSRNHKETNDLSLSG